ncbi:hypothetical protein D3C84_1180700 [compost metagenome]
MSTTLYDLGRHMRDGSVIIQHNARCDLARFHTFRDRDFPLHIVVELVNLHLLLIVGGFDLKLHRSGN